MSETTSFILAMAIVAVIGYVVGFLLPQYWYITLPAMFAFGYFGGPVIQKLLLKNFGK